MKTALIAGATGLVGSSLVRTLLEDESFSKIVAFTRRSADINHPRFREYIVDFNRMSDWGSLITGDVLFSAMGTTRAKSGSKEAQFKVDYTYQFEMARIAAMNKVPVMVLVSAYGANPKSPSFYMSMKGKLDTDLVSLGFESLNILRPGALDGKRNEQRNLEELAVKGLHLLNRIGILKSYLPIPGHTVAAAMIEIFKNAKHGVHIHNHLSLFELASQYLHAKVQP